MYRISLIVKLCFLFVLWPAIIVLFTIYRPLKPSQHQILELGTFGILEAQSVKQWGISRSTKKAINIKSIQIIDNSIRVKFNRNYHEIYWGAAGGNEVYTANGINCKASIEYDMALIFCTKNGEPVTAEELVIPGADIWLYINGEYLE